MAKSFTCWVIVSGTTPTAFRARTRETLLPTLHQLQRTQPDTVLRWFERNRLWSSPLEAREALHAKRAFRQPRDRAWRPGGDHRDRRAKYELSRDEKRARFKRRQRAPLRKPGRGPRPPK
jgi:hypothetical protein